MTHQFIHACAGSGKTKHVIDHCIQGASDVRRLIITLTTSGQDELERRFQKAVNCSSSIPEVSGWYAFLLDHIVRPYLPLKFPNQRLNGFIFDSGDAKSSVRFKPKTDARRYFNEIGMAYKDNLEDLAVSLMDEADGLVENRLGLIYDEIIIDEAQDISRAGLEVVARLLHQDSIRCLLVGDSRQSLLDSSLASKKNKYADRQSLLKWYQQFKDEGCLTITEKVETYRFNKAIASFSDSIFPPSDGFSSTVSLMNERTYHDGVFLVAKEDLMQYATTFEPVILRHSKNSWKSQVKLNPINFGVSKGRTYERVMILPTKPIQDFCLLGKYLKDKSACGFYVAVTRAKYSVAIVIDRTRKELQQSAISNIPVWSP